MMHIVFGHKVDVRWLHNPFWADINPAYESSYGRTVPVLLIDGKIKNLEPIGGIRVKFFYRNKFVVKISDVVHDAGDFAKKHKRISLEDRIYFPRVLVIDVLNDFIVQEYVKLKPVRGRAKKSHIETVARLRDKYKLEDVELSYSRFCNWGIDAKTDRPIIFDFVS